MNAVSCRHYLCYKGLLENILNIFVAFVCHNHPTIGLVLITVVCSVCLWRFQLRLGVVPAFPGGVSQFHTVTECQLLFLSLHGSC